MSRVQEHRPGTCSAQALIPSQTECLQTRAGRHEATVSASMLAGTQATRDGGAVRLGGRLVYGGGARGGHCAAGSAMPGPALRTWPHWGSFPIERLIWPCGLGACTAWRMSNHYTPPFTPVQPSSSASSWWRHTRCQGFASKKHVHSARLITPRRAKGILSRTPGT